mmetsp:Transcript_9967/g.26128  ORF Transcript_9967/g.26128 Transcript_9967/m.26128 type:complete len:104 (+) Transcript_9967:136-447(+)|eukprot:CAMPEP_0174901746 /NCGR_PEP_ID=MMETSP0167-20121228/35555_1 /TAXON_ID=38298 /ORGANISM="Rhodella maculata, Strain CCMP736" /LENGTH=103 /DNA_ID=CAMNT_0016143515 /DNA_START=51 /DNA_END=362 /DNA_ORIENTATION=+
MTTTATPVTTTPRCLNCRATVPAPSPAFPEFCRGECYWSHELRPSCEMRRSRAKKRAFLERAAERRRSWTGSESDSGGEEEGRGDDVVRWEVLGPGEMFLMEK